MMRIARRRWWLILLMMLVAGGAAFLTSSREAPQYSASATVLVNPGQGTVSADYNALQASKSLAETYRLLITTGPVLDRVEDKLGLVDLKDSISTSIIGETQLIEVTVTDTDPQRAALVANTLVDEFQAYVAEQAAKRAETTRTGLDEQIASLESRLREVDARIKELDTPENDDDSAVQQQIADLTQERTNINASLTELNTNSITLNTALIAASAQVETADPADAPKEPFAPRPLRSALLGLAVGLVLSIGLIALLEYLDNTVKPEQNLQAMTGAPVLATISSLGKLTPGGQQVFSLTQPTSSAAESMRLLRTNLEFASTSGEIEALTITSPNPGEGKSTIAANLGVVMAQAGLSVVVIDADLRRPTQHRIFGIDNRTGLTTLLTHPETEWDTVGRKVALPGLTLVPSGPLPPNPSDLVSSDRFEKLLQKLKEDVDLVIIDSPPVLSASDALSMAAHSDGLLMVCMSHGTRIDALRHASHSVHQGGIRLVGLVLNRQRGQQGASYYGEYYAPTVSSAAD
jgi:non-specific protein-tyrosine kinase